MGFTSAIQQALYEACSVVLFIYWSESLSGHLLAWGHQCCHSWTGVALAIPSAPREKGVAQMPGVPVLRHSQNLGNIPLQVWVCTLWSHWFQNVLGEVSCRSALGRQKCMTTPVTWSRWTLPAWWDLSDLPGLGRASWYRTPLQVPEVRVSSRCTAGLGPAGPAHVPRHRGWKWNVLNQTINRTSLYAPHSAKKNKKCPVLHCLRAAPVCPPWVVGKVPHVGLVTHPEGHSALLSVVRGPLQRWAGGAGSLRAWHRPGHSVAFCPQRK